MIVQIAQYDIYTGQKSFKEIEVENEEIAKEFQWIEDQRQTLRESIVTGDRKSLVKFYQDNKYCTRFINNDDCSGCKGAKDCPYLRALAC